MSHSPSIKKILILGGGFGGIYTLKKIQKIFQNQTNVHISLVSKDNYFLYTPMLPEMAAGLIHPNDITIPIRKLCKQAEYYQAQISSIDLENRLVTITRTFDGKVHALEYDYLVLALGTSTNFYGNKNIEDNSFVIKNVEDAIAIRTEIIDMLESAAQTGDKEFQKKLMTFTVVGGGFAGVETMGEINQLIRDSVKNFYPSIGEDKINMILVTSGDHILPELGPKMGKEAGEYLEKVGVKVITNTKAIDAGEDYVELDNGEKIQGMSLIWAAGNTIDQLISELKCKHDKSGKVNVDKYLRSLDYPNVFALGDCAFILNPTTGKPHPPTAQNALHQSGTVAHNLHAAISGKEDFKEFTFESRGMMTTLGRKVAIAVIFGYHLKGILAWLIWRTYYLSQLPMREKKFRVMTSWTADLLFKRDLTFVGKIKKKTLTKINIKEDAPSIKDLFRDL